jgi:hypothetical protein
LIHVQSEVSPDTVYIQNGIDESEFIQDLLKLPTAQSISEAPIHLDHNSNVVRHFVDYVTSSRLYNIHLDMTGFEQLLDLCDHFQSPAIEKCVLASIQATLEEGRYGSDFDPWTIFGIAARRDSFHLAKAAVVCVYCSGVDLRDLLIAKPPSFYDDIPPRYLHALLRSTFAPITAFKWRKGPPCDCLQVQDISDMIDNFSLE